MPLDRQSIEKRDFPIGRRGYEPEAVDAHLSELAGEVDALQRASRRRSTESLASAASEQVRTIVEAAETSAQEIERGAEEEASRIRAEATRDAERTREEAVDHARGHVGKVQEATALMQQRVDAMDSELSTLVDSLRTGGNRLTADLSLLEGNMSDLYGAAGGTRGVSAPEPTAPVSFESAPALTEPDTVEDEEAQDEDDDQAAQRTLAAVPDVPGEPSVAPAGGPEPEGGDVEGARLIALNMALNGQSRDETDRYLAENFDLPDRAGLLDEVYASIEG